MIMSDRPVAARPASSPTIRDVAKLAGVSMMTVSRVLSGKTLVSAEKRAAVQRAISDLNYVPNTAAKALVLARHARRIAFLFDTPNATILGELVNAVLDDRLRPAVKLTFMRVCGDADPRAALGALKDQGVHGVVLTPPLCDDVRLRIMLANAQIRFVALGSSDPDPSFSAIGTDDRQAARELTRHLLELGHRRIGLIAGHVRHRSTVSRGAGFEDALAEFGLRPDAAMRWDGDYTFGTAIGIAERALSLDPPLTAIFATNDDMAAAVISVARGRGIAVPDALSVCGFDNSEIARMMCPQITTVSRPLGQMAIWALEQLSAELNALAEGNEPQIRKVLLDYAIAFRGSDGPPPDNAAGKPPSAQERHVR